MIENINWYPGHMKKTRELIAENLRLVGAVIEVCDARIPVSSRNPVFDEIISGKPRVLVFNKSDLADEEETKKWAEQYRGENRLTAVAVNSLNGDGVKKLFTKLAQIPTKTSLRVMIVGVPNSGKSSLINRLTGRRAAQTGDRPGVTRGKQWLTLENGMQLLDTPGILRPKFTNPNEGLNLAFCGSIKDEIMDIPDLALELIRVLDTLYPNALAARFGIESGDSMDFYEDTDGIEVATENAGSGQMGYAGYGDADESDTDRALSLMEEIARLRGCLLPGKRIDYERTGRMILDEFRAGKLGRMTLEKIMSQSQSGNILSDS